MSIRSSSRRRPSRLIMEVPQLTFTRSTIITNSSRRSIKRIKQTLIGLRLLRIRNRTSMSISR